MKRSAVKEKWGYLWINAMSILRTVFTQVSTLFTDKTLSKLCPSCIANKTLQNKFQQSPRLEDNQKSVLELLDMNFKFQSSSDFTLFTSNIMGSIEINIIHILRTLLERLWTICKWVSSFPTVVAIFAIVGVGGIFHLRAVLGSMTTPSTPQTYLQRPHTSPFHHNKQRFSKQNQVILISSATYHYYLWTTAFDYSSDQTMLSCSVQHLKIGHLSKLESKHTQKKKTLFFSHSAFSGQDLAMWSLALQMKQLSPGLIPGTRRGCLLPELPLIPGSFSFLRLNSAFRLFFFFFFLSGSFGGVGSVFVNSSGCSSLYRFRASRCLWLTISNEQ